MRKYVLACALATPYLPVPALAQASVSSSSSSSSSDPSPQALTLAEAWRQAQAHNPELAIARLELPAQEAAALQAGLRPNPELGVQLEDTRKSSRTTTVQWSQAIELGGKRDARLSVAARSREQAGAALQAKQAELRAAVGTAFHELLAAQAQVQLVESALVLARRASAMADKRLQAGKIAPLEQTKALLAEAGVRAELGQAQSDLRAAQRRLSLFWGASPLRFERAEGDAEALPALPSEAQLNAQLAEAPLLRQARLDVERRQALSASERSQRTPDLTVTLGAKRDAELGRTQAIIGLSMPLPLLDRRQGHLLEALRREDQARESLVALSARVQAELADGLARLRLARQQAQLLRAEVLPAAQQAVDAALRGYELGKFAILDVLDAQRTLIQLQQQALRSTVDAHRAAADLDRLLGRPEPQATE